MPYIICPNCSALVRSGDYCSHCNLPLASLLGQAAYRDFAVRPDLRAAASPQDFILDAERETKPKATPDIDPHLLREKVRAQQDVRILSTSSTRENQVGVIARVTDVDAFDEILGKIEGTSVGLRIGPSPGSRDKTAIVTARIPILEALKIRDHRNVVKSLKSSRRLHLHRSDPDLSGAASDAQALRGQLPDGNLADGGKGVIVGIVDTRLNFTDKRFLREDNSTRLLFFWNQPAKKESELGSIGPQGYGKVYTREEINEALKTSNSFEKLGYERYPTPINAQTHHATFVADIAVGTPWGESNEKTSIPGIAPNADVIFVEMAKSDIAVGEENVLEATLGDSAQLLEAIAFIFEKAGGRPCVVNVSMGTSGGPHDGSSLVEDGIDRLVTQAPNRAVVMAAGNFFGDKIHLSHTVSSSEPFDLQFEVTRGDATGNELEIWYSSEDHFEIDVIAPRRDGTPGEETLLARVDLGEYLDIQSPGEGSKIFLVHRPKDSANGQNLINIFLESRLPSGKWTLRLNPKKVVDGKFHAWIERDEIKPLKFVEGDGEFTLSSIACGHKSIAVGAYDLSQSGMPPLSSSSAGPTLSMDSQPGRQKPELSAQGIITSLTSLSGVRNNLVYGTSVAAPIVTGIVALLLAHANSPSGKGPLSIDEIRQTLIESAKTRKDATTGQQWHKQLGHGRASASAALQMIL